ncbi:MAG: hypothetical protein ACP5N1_06240 [Candidatus Woesearchaeota archaeon]
MTNNIDEFSRYLDRISIDESLSSLLRDKIKENMKIESTPKTYYIVTNLINPQQTYMRN